jgi:hypothetical protein
MPDESDPAVPGATDNPSSVEPHAPQDSDQEEGVWILGLEGPSRDRDVRFWKPSEARIGRRKIPAAALRDQIGDFVGTLDTVVEPVPETVGGFAIDSIELSAEISVSGQVSLLGTGGQVSGTGGITFTLTRRKPGGG